MRKLVVSEFLTLDGVMQAPGGPDEDRSGGFDHGGWQMPFFDEIGGQEIGAGMGRTGGFLLGRVTYDIFAGYWPSASPGPIADTMNRLPKYVASRTLREPLQWENSTLLGDPPPGVGQGEALVPRGHSEDPDAACHEQGLHVGCGDRTVLEDRGPLVE